MELYEIAVIDHAAAKFARTQAASPQVRDFARRMKDDNEKLVQRTKEFAARRGIKLSQVNPEQDEALRYLQEASGPRVDVLFVHTISAHEREILSLLDRADASQDPELRQLAQELRPTAMRHRQMAAALRSGMNMDAPPAQTSSPY